MRALHSLAFAAAAGAVIPSPVGAADPLPVRNEVVNLNIAREHIVRENFRADLTVDVQPAAVRQTDVTIGAIVTARTITVDLDNVHGRVEFHGDLTRLQQLFDQHQRR